MSKYYMLESSGDDADLYIFGDITSYPWLESDRSSHGIVKELQELEAKNINVHINSYGGEVAEGLAIYNVLKNHSAKITTYCDGFACSSASVVFMAGDVRLMNEASLLMIHNAWKWASGDANELRKQADDLDIITQASINVYMSKVTISEEELKQLMNVETWLTAEDAVKCGFATGTVETAKNGVNQSALGNIRKRILGVTVPTAVLEQDAIGLEDLADQIVEKLTGRLHLQPTEMLPERKSYGFENYFNKKKGE